MENSEMKRDETEKSKKIKFSEREVFPTRNMKNKSLKILWKTDIMS